MKTSPNWAIELTFGQFQAESLPDQPGTGMADIEVANIIGGVLDLVEKAGLSPTMPKYVDEGSIQQRLERFDGQTSRTLKFYAGEIRPLLETMSLIFDGTIDHFGVESAGEINYDKLRVVKGILLGYDQPASQQAA